MLWTAPPHWHVSTVTVVTAVKVDAVEILAQMRWSLLALSGRAGAADQCPLSRLRRTLQAHTVMAAYDPKRTSLKRYMLAARAIKRAAGDRNVGN